MIHDSVIRRCFACDKPLRGRADKKYCDDSCRNYYHNHVRYRRDEKVKKVNAILSKNLNILESLLPRDRDHVVVTKEYLLELGFNFKFVTHLAVSNSNKLFHFCYWIGYHQLNEDCFLLTRAGA